MAAAFAIVAPEGGAMLVLPDSAFTDRQRAAIAPIVANRGVDPLPAATVPARAAVTDQVASAHTPSPSDEIRRKAIAEAGRAQGFSGDICDQCGSPEMKRSGTCLTCQDCGATTGCS